jgi:hypothetical protein
MIAMINEKGVNMKRLIALLVAAVLSITIISPPVAAVCPDPSKPVPWMDPGVTPEGDDSGWHEADSEGGHGIVVILDLFKICGSRYFVIHFIPNKIDNSGSIERDVPSNNADIPTSRNASTR